MCRNNKENTMTKQDMVLKVHDAIIENTESLVPHAIFLAYLYPAMLREGSGYIDIDKTVPEEMAFVRFLETVFAESHYIWNYIEIA